MPGTLPLKRDVPSAAGATPWAGGVILLLVLAGAAFVLLRRRGAPSPTSPWRARAQAGAAVVRLSSQALTPQSSVHAVRWNDEELLLGCSAQQVTLLARRPAAPEGEAP